MFDQVANRYDLMNSLLTLRTDEMWRKATLEALEIEPGMMVLDLAAGTGTSSKPIADAGAKVYPTDLSLGMLTVGKQRHPELDFLAGDALALPFADDSFDAATISFGLRNVENTDAVLQEIARVTRPGGRLVITEFSTPTQKAIRLAYQQGVLRRVMPVAARLSSNPPAYTYLGESIMAWPNQKELADLMAKAGWVNIQWRNLTGGIVAIHRGWIPW